MAACFQSLWTLTSTLIQILYSEWLPEKNDCFLLYFICCSFCFLFCSAKQCILFAKLQSLQKYMRWNFLKHHSEEITTADSLGGRGKMLFKLQNAFCCGARLNFSRRGSFWFWTTRGHHNIIVSLFSFDWPYL